MDTSTAEIERTVKLSQELEEKTAALAREIQNSEQDLDRLVASCQTELSRLGEVLKSPKATGQMGEECFAAAWELATDWETFDALLAEATTTGADAAVAGKDATVTSSPRRGMRV